MVEELVMQETKETAVVMQQEAESVKAPTLTLDAEERKVDFLNKFIYLLFL